MFNLKELSTVEIKCILEEKECRFSSKEICNITMIWLREIDIFIPVHKMFIMSLTHIDNIGILKHEKHLWLLSSGTKLSITFELKGFSTWGRERHNLSMKTFPSPPPTMRGTCRQASMSSKSQPSSLDIRIRLPHFSQISAHASGAWCHSHLLVTFSIWDFYFDISEWYILPACAWTPALILHLTNPCTKRKVLSLTKLKGKKYKTKSICHYITNKPKVVFSRYRIIVPLQEKYSFLQFL